MNFFESIFAQLKSIVVQVFGVIVDHPVAFAIVSTIVLGAAVVAGIMDEKGRELDAIIDEALDNKEGTDQ